MNSLTPEVYNSLFEVANPEEFEIFGISLDESAPRENITPNQWREYDEILDQNPSFCKLAFFKMTFDVMIDLLAECENGHELLVTLDAIVSQD